MRITKLIKVLLSVFFLHLPISAQVTIGSSAQPIDGALLQLKENNNTAANSTKGLALPRVNLTSPTDVTTITGMAANTAGYVGLTVYHVNSANTAMVEGVYAWTGDIWIQLTKHVTINTASSPWYNQSNGNSAEAGDHQIYLKTSDSSLATVAIGKNTAGTGLTLDVDGKVGISGNTRIGSLTVDNIPNTGGSSQALTRNVVTGNIELAAEAPRKLAFYQSDVESDISDAAIKAGVVVPFVESDKLTNNNLCEAPVNGAFELKEAAIVEISAYVCYIGGGVSYDTKTGKNPEIVVNATIQYAPAGTNNWVDLSSVRGVYPNAVSYYINTLNIPPVMWRCEKGDKIRIRLIQPPTSSPTPPSEGVVGYLGATHKSAKISVPYGTKFSKGIKIIVQ